MKIVSEALRSAALHAVRVSKNTVWLFVVLETNCGNRGYGEASRPGAEASIVDAAKRILPRLGSVEIQKPAQFSDGARPASIADAAIVSAVDHALWDLFAQSRNTRLPEVLRGVERKDIAVYANINRRTVDRSPTGFADSARVALQSGYTAFKIAPFDEVTVSGCGSGTGTQDMERGLDRIRAVREVVGSNARLMVDCHWRFNEEAARTMISEVCASGIYWVECPIAETVENIGSITRLRASTNSLGMRLAGLEDGVGIDAFRPYVEAGAYDVVMPDVKYFGGLKALVDTTDWFADKGVEVSLHNPSGPISHAISLAVSAAVRSVDTLERQFDESPLFGDLATTPLPICIKGRSSLPRRRGIGTSLDPHVLAANADAVTLNWNLLTGAIT